MKKNISRRDFLAQSGSLALMSSSVLSTFGVFQKALAAANTSGGYKALVCLHMAGGNNGHNFIVPIDSAGYATYAAGRTNLALAQSSLLPLGTSGYGIHPNCPELQALYNSNNLAVVANVGNLIAPVTLAQAKSGTVPLPPQLFAHNDQANQFLSGQANSISGLGWSGKLADLLVTQGLKPNLAFAINASGVANPWQVGATTTPYFYGSNGAPSIAPIAYSGSFYGARATAFNSLVSSAANSNNPLIRQHSAIVTSSVTKSTTVNQALQTAGDLTTVFPSPVRPDGTAGDWGLGAQLHEVARIIKAQSVIGDVRQMFFVEIGGFDTHGAELATQAGLLTYVSQYISTFQKAMVELNMQNNVTLFTTSDFGRTLTSNNGGADHGWGNHHIVVGGAVKGGQIYGTFPDLTLGGPNDFGYGRLLPTTSSDQVAAKLAQWFGVTSATDLANIFPNVGNFDSSKLTIMGA